MKALGVAFSARKRGNCLNCTEYVLAKLKEQGFEAEVINTFDCEIKPCSPCNYECFAQQLRGKEEEFKDIILNKIIGNIPAGGDLAYHTVILDHKDCKHPPSSVLLQSAEYGKCSIYGNLLDDEKVRERLDNLVRALLKDWESKCRIED